MNDTFKHQFKKSKNILIVCEHNSFKKKIFADLPALTNLNYLIIYYKNRKISQLNIKLLFKIFSYFFKSNSLVISEYFNFIPRLIAIITRSHSLSVIYGVLTKNNFNIQSKYPFTFIKPLFADTFYVVNREYTSDILKSNMPKSLIKLFKINRNIKGKISNYCLWVSQCWEEDKNYSIEKFQKELILKISKISNLIVVMHPRENSDKYKNFNFEIILNINSVFELIKERGLPKYVFGLSSSALLELKDYNLNVFRFENSIVREFNANNLDLHSISLLNKNKIDQLFK